jgi:hypothetical protein
VWKGSRDQYPTEDRSLVRAHHAGRAEEAFIHRTNADGGVQDDREYSGEKDDEES